MSWPWIVVLVAVCVYSLGLTVLVLGLLRRTAGVLEHAEAAIRSGQVGLGGLAAGASVPPVEVTSSDGRRVALDDLLAQPAVVLMVSASCSPCRDLVDELVRTGPVPMAAPLIVIAYDLAELPRLSEMHWALVFNEHGQVAEAFNQPARPQAFAIDAGGLVRASLVPMDARDLQQLALRHLGHPKLRLAQTVPT